MLITELLAGLTTKLAGLGMAAKAGMGVTLAAASTTAAGAAGVLPAPAQHAVATVVATATPFTFPDAANDRADVGATVSADATQAGVDGKAVSEAAKTEANQTPAAGRAPTSLPAAAADAGSKASTGLGTGASTPAAGNVPTSVPAAPGTGSQGSAGVTTADDTPAAGRIPANLPGRP